MNNAEKHQYISVIAEMSYRKDCEGDLSEMFVLNRFYLRMKLLALKIVLKAHLRPSWSSMTLNDWSKS